MSSLGSIPNLSSVNTSAAPSSLGRSRYYRRRYRRFNRRYRRYKRGRNRSTYRSMIAALAQNRRYENRRAYRRNLYNNIRGTDANKAYFGEDWNSATDEQKARRRAMRYYGQGDYWSDFKKGGWFGKNEGMGAALRGLGGAIGGYLGPGGSALGTSAGGAVSKWLGFGDYTTPTTANQLMGGGTGGDSQMNISVNPMNHTGDVYISHTEFIGNVTATALAAGGSAFQQTVIPLNPGISSSFPWLSQIAANFELYDWEGLVFQYKPTSGESATSTNALGKVILATQYDNDANAFLNSVEMQNYDYANSSKPSCGLLHGVETDQRQQAVNMMYVRTGNTTRDKTFTDLGKLVIATEGIPFSAAGTQIIGELWVSYRIKLSRATLYSALLGLTIPFDQFWFTSNATKLDGASSLANPKNYGVWTASVNAGSPLRYLDFKSALNLISGCFQITIATSYTAAQAAAYTWAVPPTAVRNCSVIKMSDKASATLLDGFNAGMAVGEVAMMETFFIEVNNTDNQGAYFQALTNNNLPTGARTTIIVTQVSCLIKEQSII